MAVGYKLPDGRILFVHDGISDGKWWGTFYRKASGSSLKRFVAPSLPMREQKAQAEKDLEFYAVRNNLIKVEV
ncbi:MAG: hypothetical protein M1379_03825 [Firmicutes bacterium]|nr:hypothetical protein [Bacillota bacterium]